MTRIREILTILLAHSRARDRAIDTLNFLANKLGEHIVMLLLWQDNTNDFNHWSSEICNFLIEVCRLKVKGRGNKRLKKEDYKYYLFDPNFENFDEFEDIIKTTTQKLIYTENYPFVEYTLEDVKDMWKRYKLFEKDCLDLFANKDRIIYL